ncbi:MAG: matrixin family metalloprotease, partial [Myxococcota bacterium]
MNLLILSTLWIHDVQAYGFIRTEDGTPLRWTAPNQLRSDMPYLPFVGNPRNQSEINWDVLQDAVVHSLQRWEHASGDAFAFDYWQGDDASIYIPALRRDGVSSIFFASNALYNEDVIEVLQGSIAYTQIWYDEYGAINEADIILNDLLFRFETDPALARYDVGGLGPSKIFLEDVLTHEIGHALGLTHSGAMGSTMFTWSWFDQSTVSCDDALGIRDLYDAPASGGAITGAVVGEDDVPIFAAQAVAISMQHHRPVAAAFTEKDGTYRIEGLPAGDYLVMIEPLYAGEESLSEYYDGEVSHTLCGKSLFARHLIEQVVEIEAGSISQMPTATVGCELNITPRSDQVALIPSGLDDALFYFTDTFEDTTRRRYDLTGMSGWLEMTAISYSLFSPLMLGIDVETDRSLEDDVSLPAQEDPATGWQIFDTYLFAELSGEAASLELKPNFLATEMIPGNERYVDPQNFSLIIGSLKAELDALPAPLACESEPDFYPYQSPEGLPPRKAVAYDGSLRVAGCTETSSVQIASIFLPIGLW